MKMEIEGFSLHAREKRGGNDSVPVLRTVCAVTLLRCYTFLSIASIGVENKRPLAIETALFLLLRVSSWWTIAESGPARRTFISALHFCFIVGHVLREAASLREFPLVLAATIEWGTLRRKASCTYIHAKGAKYKCHRTLAVWGVKAMFMEFMCADLSVKTMHISSE